MTEKCSVVICTHNRAPSVRRLLDSLAKFEGAPGVEVEFVVVANACTDDTCATVPGAAARNGNAIRCIEAPRQGLSRARNRGVAESGGDIIAMLDDDVLLEPGWLKGLVDLHHSQAADIVASRVLLDWDGGRPEWLTRRLERILPANDLGDDVFEIRSRGDVLGTSFSFRRRAFERLGGFREDLGRSGSGLMGGEEVDFVQRAISAGMRVFYAPGSVVRHVMASERMTPDYLCAYARGQAMTRIFIDPGMSRSRALRKLASGSVSAAVGVFAEGLCSVIGSRSGRLECRSRRSAALGKVTASWMVLTGKAPRVSGPTPPFPEPS